MFQFADLVPATRQYMLQELEEAVKSKSLYMSKRFTPNGVIRYPELLKQAMTDGNEESLGNTLKITSSFKSHEEYTTKKGPAVKKVPENAHITLAEGEFNMFYMRAIFLRALEEGKKVQVYRARHSDSPRYESQVLEGQFMDPKKLLDDLRTSIGGVDSALGLPPGPNSGLSIKLV